MISGTPTQEGTFQVRLVATSSLGTGLSQQFSIVVAPAASITLAARYDLEVGRSVAIVPGTGELQAPVTFAISPALPPGLTLTPETGFISGIPTQPIAATTFTLTGGSANGAIASRSFVMAVSEARFVLELPPETYATIDHPFELQIASRNGAEPLQFALAVDSAPLPDGLSLSETGAITGIPSTTGSFAGIVVEAQDAIGRTTRSGPMTLLVLSDRLASVSGIENARWGNRAEDRLLAFELTDGVNSNPTSSGSIQNAANAKVVRFSSPVTADGVFFAVRGSSGTATIQAMVDGTWQTVTTRSITVNVDIASYVQFPGPVTSDQFRVYSSASTQAVREFRLGFQNQAPIAPTWTTPAGYVGRAGETVQLAATSANAWITEPLHFMLDAASTLPPGTTLTTGGTLTIGTFEGENHEFVVRVSDGRGGPSADRLFRIGAQHPYASTAGPIAARQGNGAESRRMLETLYDGEDGAAAAGTVSVEGVSNAIEVRFARPVIANEVFMVVRGGGSLAAMNVQAFIDGAWRELFVRSVGSNTTSTTRTSFSAVAATRFRIFAVGSNATMREFRLGYNGDAPVHPTWTTPEGYLGRAGEIVDLAASSVNAWIAAPLHFALAPGSTLPAGTTLDAQGRLVIANFAAENHEFTVRVSDGEGGANVDRDFRISSLHPYASQAGGETAWFASNPPSRELLERLTDGNTSTAAIGNSIQGLSNAVTVDLGRPVIVDGFALAARGGGSSTPAHVQGFVNGAWRTVASRSVGANSDLSTTVSFPNGAVTASRFRIYAESSNVTLREFRLGFGDQHPVHPTWNTPPGYLGRGGETVALSATSVNPWLNGPIVYTLAPLSSLPSGTTLSANGTLTIGSNLGSDNHEFTVRASDRAGGAGIERRFWVSRNVPLASVVLPETSIRAGVESRANMEALYDGNTTTNVTTFGGASNAVTIRFLGEVLADTIVLSFNSGSLHDVVVEARFNGEWRQVAERRNSSFNGTLTFDEGAVASSEFRVRSTSTTANLREFRLGYGGNAPVWTP